MHRSWSHSELPPPPWLDPNHGLVYDSYAKHQKPFKRQQDFRDHRRRQQDSTEHRRRQQDFREERRRQQLEEDHRGMRFPPKGSSPPIRVFHPPTNVMYHPQAADIQETAAESGSTYSGSSYMSDDSESIQTSSESSGNSERLAGYSSDIVRAIPDRVETYRARQVHDVHRPIDRSRLDEVDKILGFKVLRRESDHETTPIEVSPGTANQPWLISQSHYNGNELRAGPHSVRVTKIPHPEPSERHLFRWVHMEQPMMDFGMFTEKISQIPLVESEKQQLKDFVSDIRSKAMQRLLINGQRCRGLFHLEPGVKSRGVFTWICMPYFTYEEYSALEDAATKSTSPCPAQTLMQAYSSSSSKKMDLEQAICKVSQPQRDCVLHVSQLWCIIVGQCEYCLLTIIFSRRIQCSL